jgi:hemoglobin-like flavoprotein
MSSNNDKYHQALKYVGARPDEFCDIFYEHVANNMADFDNIFRNTDLKLQKLELAKGLFVISSLLDEQDELVSFLENLGARHVCYEVQYFHYPEIKKALLMALEEFYDHDWCIEVKNTWETLVDTVLDSMKSGAEKLMKRSA